MKTIIIKTLEGLLVLLSIFVLGIFVPLLISLFIIITTDTLLQECIQTAPFFLFTIIGWIVSSVYINEIINRE